MKLKVVNSIYTKLYIASTNLIMLEEKLKIKYYLVFLSLIVSLSLPRTLKMMKYLSSCNLDVTFDKLLEILN